MIESGSKQIKSKVLVVEQGLAEMSGVNFGDDVSPQIRYLKTLGLWHARFPGFEHEVEGAELANGVYNVLCLKR
jgi:hypothetical protein